MLPPNSPRALERLRRTEHWPLDLFQLLLDRGNPALVHQLSKGVVHLFSLLISLLHWQSVHVLLHRLHIAFYEGLYQFVDLQFLFVRVFLFDARGATGSRFFQLYRVPDLLRCGT